MSFKSRAPMSADFQLAVDEYRRFYEGDGPVIDGSCDQPRHDGMIFTRWSVDQILWSREPFWKRARQLFVHIPMIDSRSDELMFVDSIERLRHGTSVMGIRIVLVDQRELWVNCIGDLMEQNDVGVIFEAIYSREWLANDSRSRDAS